MADQDVEQSQTGAALRGRQSSQGLFGQWSDWLDNDQNRAALIGFGAKMMQPRQAGQTPLGAFGESLSAGGEAAQNVGKEQRAQEEAESKQDVREARARTAEMGAAYQTQRTQEAGRRRELEEAVRPLDAYLEHQRIVAAENKEIDKRNADARATDIKAPQEARKNVLPYEEFLRTYNLPRPKGPLSRMVAGAGGASGGGQQWPVATDEVKTRFKAIPYSPQAEEAYNSTYGPGAYERDGLRAR